MPAQETSPRLHKISTGFMFVRGAVALSTMPAQEMSPRLHKMSTGFLTGAADAIEARQATCRIREEIRMMIA